MCCGNALVYLVGKEYNSDYNYNNLTVKIIILAINLSLINN